MELRRYLLPMTRKCIRLVGFNSLTEKATMRQVITAPFGIRKVTLLALNSSGIRYTRNKSWESFPVNVIEVLVILKGQNSALGIQNLTV